MAKFQSVDPAVFQGQQITAANQAKKEELELEAQRLANQRAAQQAQIEADKAALENASKQAELNRQAKLQEAEMTQQGFREQREQAAKFHQENLEESRRQQMLNLQLEDLNNEFNQEMMNKVSYSSQQYNNQASPGMTAFPTTGSPEDRERWLEEQNTFRKNYDTEVGDLIIERKEKELQMGRAVPFAEDEFLDWAAQLDSEIVKQNETTKGILNFVNNYTSNMMGNPGVWQNVLTTFDMDAATEVESWGGFWRKALEGVEEESPLLGLRGHIAVPSSVRPEDLEGYDFLWGKEGVLKGLQGRRRDVPNVKLERAATNLENKILSLQVEEGKEIRSALLDKGYSEKQVDSLEGIFKGYAWEQGLTKHQGVEKDDWIKSRILVAEERLGKELSLDEEGFVTWVNSVAEGSGWNPLLHPDAVKHIRGEKTSGGGAPFSLNPYGEEGEVYARGASGETAFMRYVGQMAKGLDTTHAGLGDALLTSVFAIQKFKASGGGDEALKTLQQELGEVSNRNGGGVFFALDGILDSWGNELAYEAGDPGVSASSIIAAGRENNFGLEADQENLIRDMDRAASDMQKVMGEISGIWNSGIGGGYGGTTSLAKDVQNAAYKRFAESIGKTQIDDDIVDQVWNSARRQINATYKGAPEEVVNALATRMLEGLDSSFLEQRVTEVQDLGRELDELLDRESELELQFSEDLSELALQQMLESEEYQKERREEYRGRRQEAIDEYLGVEPEDVEP